MAKGRFCWILGQTCFPDRSRWHSSSGIVVAQYLCGLATVTSASRMAYAFARDGGLPFSPAVRWVCPRRRSPAVAIWAVSAAAVLFTLYTPVYSTITAVCTIFLYLSYVVPTILGARAYGRTWTTMGPWNLGRWYRPLAWLSAGGCIALIAHRHAAAQRAIGLGRGGNESPARLRLVRDGAAPVSGPSSSQARWGGGRQTSERLALILFDLKGSYPWTTQSPVGTSNIEISRGSISPARPRPPGS